MTYTIPTLLLLDSAPATLAEWHSVIHQGFSKDAAKNLAKEMKVPEKDFMLLACDGDLPGPRVKVLSRDASNFLYRTAEVFILAVQKFGSPEKASEWLRTPNSLIKNAVPLLYLQCEISTSVVKVAIERS